jgi:hypothetical protein
MLLAGNIAPFYLPKALPWRHITGVADYCWQPAQAAGPMRRRIPTKPPKHLINKI